MSAEPTPPQDRPMSGFVDWEFAKATGKRLVPAGPSATPAQAAALVEELRRSAVRARQPVADTGRLEASGDEAPTFVVDRASWIDVNVDSLQAMLEPVIAHLAGRRPLPHAPLVNAVGGKLTGAEAGGLMAFLATKVLGQYDPAPEGTPKLLLVAPNILEAEIEMEVDPSDFRLWVCIHEETHRVQFTAVPWLRGHLLTRARELAMDLTPDVEHLGERLGELARRLPEVLRGDRSPAELLASPEQRERLAELTAVMSLVEGHAEVVTESVGPSVIATADAIREQFRRRRQGLSTADRMLRRLLGLESKMRQYRDGAAFVRGVIEKVGVDNFNAVWTSPETLPTPAEIEDPQRWVSRVHG